MIAITNITFNFFAMLMGRYNYYDSNLLTSFYDYTVTYNKTYSLEDIYSKYTSFVENKIIIDRDNRHQLSKFADMSRDDFNKYIGSCAKFDWFPSRRWRSCTLFNEDTIDIDSIPDSIDWRKLNAVTAVKNQGECGSCWSFSATGAIEGAYGIATGNLYNFSEQELVDCVERNGCNGGLMEDAFEYVIMHDLCYYNEIPYNAKYERCSKDACQDGIRLKGCVSVPSGNETALKLAVSRGPVSVAIEADTSVFQLYTSGIITSDRCGTNLNHGVLVVGYGEESGEKYWIVKNSWGVDWGEDGYVRIARHDDDTTTGTCGIAMQASYPIY